MKKVKTFIQIRLTFYLDYAKINSELIKINIGSD